MGKSERKKKEPTICDNVAYYTMKLTNEPEHNCSEKDGCQYKSRGPPVIDFVLHKVQKYLSGKKQNKSILRTSMQVLSVFQ